jgi:hypothetical protein
MNTGMPVESRMRGNVHSRPNTQIQARARSHPSVASRPGHGQLTEHDYDRRGALCYLGGWDVFRGLIATDGRPTMPALSARNGARDVPNKNTQDPREHWFLALGTEERTGEPPSHYRFARGAGRPQYPARG